jgi:predicted ester cyclase
MATGNNTEDTRNVYLTYIGLINNRKFNDLPQVVDVQKYREVCVGFTPGWVDFNNSLISIEKVLKGIPDLSARIEETACEGSKVYARLKVTGRQTGNLFGIPATKNGFEVQMFDYVKVENGKIVERIQQADTLGQFAALFKGLLLKVAIGFLIILVGLVIALVLK